MHIKLQKLMHLYPKLVLREGFVHFLSNYIVESLFLFYIFSQFCKLHELEALVMHLWSKLQTNAIKLQNLMHLYP
jgi:hypothetical protein